MVRAGIAAWVAAALLPLLLVAACASSEPDGEAGAEVETAGLPPAELRAFVDRPVATTGDLITYTVEVERDPEVEVTLADPAADIEGLRVVDFGLAPAVTLASGRLLERRRVELRADLVGVWVLAPPKATFSGPSGDGDLEAAEVTVEVESVLPADAGEVTDIRDIKPLRRTDTTASWLLWTGLAVAAVALVFLAWWWRRRRRRPDGVGPAAPPVPPWELAMEELERLRRTDFSDLRELRRYCFAVSSVVRAYVEGRFGLNATDLTTEEILGRLGGLGRLEPLQARRLERFLVATDQVKFAAHLPAPAEVERTWEQARDFVVATRPPDDDADGGESAAAASSPTQRAA